MTLEDIAIPGVSTAGPDTVVEVLAVTMADENIGSIVIVEDDEPVGIVTDRDLAIELGAGGDPTTLTARDVMTPNPKTMAATDGVFELTAAMRTAKVRRMPIVDEDNEVVGIITMDDLVRLFVEELENLAAVVEAESPPY